MPFSFKNGSRRLITDLKRGLTDGGFGLPAPFYGKWGLTFVSEGEM